MENFAIRFAFDISFRVVQEFRIMRRLLVNKIVHRPDIADNNNTRLLGALAELPMQTH